MLKGLDPLLHADLLYVLRSMGHGDDLVICDTNFPADSIAQETVHGTPLRLDGVTAPRAIEAVLSVMPLDTFVESPASRMEVVDAPEETPLVQQEVQAVIDNAEGRSVSMGSIERHAFYNTAKQSYAVLATGERRFYGCFLLKKGVLPPEE